MVEKVLNRYFPPENVTIELNLAHNLLPIMIDASRIEQVLINLFTNAYQVMTEGGKHVITSIQGNDQASLKVEDTGTGIAKENLERIFEPLFSTEGKVLGWVVRLLNC